MGLKWTLLLQARSLLKQLLAKQRLVVARLIMDDWPSALFFEVNWAPLNEGLLTARGFGDT